MTDANELLPCPCGAMPLPPVRVRGGFKIWCANPECSRPLVKRARRADAIAAWNARAAPPPADADALARAVRERDAAVAVLRDLEWAGVTDDEDGGYNDACPCCDVAPPGPHADDCPLAAALRLAGGGTNDA